MSSGQAINIFVNGDPFEAPDHTNITVLLTLLKIAPDRVAVELNKSLVRRRDWDATGIPGGARIEIVEFVGGG